MHSKNKLTLFNLIHSLNQGEKRYFKLYVNARSSHIKNKNYLKLFTIIEKQKVYNEGKIIQMDIAKEEHLPMLKNYLYKLILESVRILNSKNEDVNTRLQNMLNNAQILFDKNMREEGVAFLKKAYNLAIKHERWGGALDALLIKMEEVTREGNLKELESTETEIGLLLNKINNLHEYLRLQRKITAITRKVMITRNNLNKPLDRLFTNPLLSDENKAMSVSARNIFYITLFHYYIYKSDLTAAYKIISKRIRFVESNYSSLNNVELIQSSLLTNLIVIQKTLKKYREAFETIQKYRLLAQNPGKAQEHAFFYSVLHEIDFYITSGNFDKGVPLVEEIEKKLNKIKTRILNSSILVFYFNSALIYFGVRNYSLAQQYIRRIINNPKVVLREDVQAAARLLQIIIHYELQTPDILDHLLMSAHRFLINRKQLYKVENSFIQFMRHIITIDSSSKELLAAFRNYRKEMVILLKNPKEQIGMYSFDFIAWIDSKIEDKSFAEIVKRKTKVKVKVK